MRNRIITNLYLPMFIIGLVVGTIAINILDKSYQEKIIVTSEHYSQMISDIAVDKGDILRNGIKEYYKEFVVILFFNFFFFGKFYNYMFLSFKGASIGMILSSYVLKYKVKGLLIFIASIFPSYLLYVPALIMTIAFGLHIRKIVIENNIRNERYGINVFMPRDLVRILKKVSIYFFTILLFAIVISFVETNINIPLLKKSLEND